MRRIGRLVGLATHRLRSEIGRISLHEKTLARDLAGNAAQFLRTLERDDAGERDGEAELDTCQSELLAGRKAMQNSLVGPLAELIRQDIHHLLIRIAGMYDEGEPGLARGGDMGAKHAALHFARAFIVVIIEPR